MRVSLFVTCLVDQLWPSIGTSAVEVLRRAGCEVEFDQRQTCCGQPAFNTGYRNEARALARRFKAGDQTLLERYSETCLRRVWRAQRFSWWMTSMLHRLSDADDFDRRRQIAELRHLTESRAAATNFAENYAGFPFD